MIATTQGSFIKSDSQFIKSINDPGNRLSQFLERLEPEVRHSGRFALAIGSTETSDLPGISAAGADGVARRLTPAIDCEALVLGTPLSSCSVPISPEGIVSPVVASRAMVGMLGCAVDVYNCGTFQPPKVAALHVGDGPARGLDSGAALDPRTVERLFNAGRNAGASLSAPGGYLAIGECVPGGTTTALAVLTALGYQAHGLVSSSMPLADHDRRGRLVEQGIRRAALDGKAVARSPLLAVAAVGDPMQPFAAGLALEASLRIPVVLGGGTQMLAVYALARAIAGDDELIRRSLCVITTKWVAFDAGAGAAQLAHMVGAPLAAACPDFSRSRHAGLRAYEHGNVKEGVGAGALMALAYLAGFDGDRIREAVDVQYDRMVLGQVG